MSTAQLPTMVSISWRTGWRTALTWVVALAALMVATTTSISGLYDTQAKIDSYASAVGSGDALMLLNGRIYGLDSLGGVIANEFGFVASFALPLMGISLIARNTRRDEESGRLELLLAGRIGRSAPLVSAVLVTSAALVLTSLALAAGLLAVGIPLTGAVVYAISLGLLGFVFAGIAALTAQVVEHARGVYAISLGALVVAYLLRGIGDTLDTWLSWLSPLGWAEQTRAFGDARWWPLLVPLVIGVLLVSGALRAAGSRDLGSALLHRSGSAAAASAFLRSPLGFAVSLHRSTVIGWAAGAVVTSGMFGLLAQNVIDAMAGNPALQQALGGAGGVDGFLAMAVMLVGLICGGYVVQAVGTLRAEEAAGRLEPILAGSASRTRWFAVHLATILGGLLVVALPGGVVLSASVAWSTGDAHAGALAAAVTAYLPAVLVLGGVAALLFGAAPRWFALAWLAFAFTALAAYLGDPLQLPTWLRDVAPTEHVGYPPQDTAGAMAFVALLAVAAVLVAAGLAAFRRRDLPAG